MAEAPIRCAVDTARSEGDELIGVVLQVPFLQGVDVRTSLVDHNVHTPALWPAVNGA